MARVPTRDNFRVLPGGGGSGRVRANASGLASVQGRDLQQVGQAVQRAGDNGSRIAEAEQDRINQARVREAALNLREDMAEAQREYEQFKGAELVAGDKPIMRDIESRVEARRNELLMGLTSQDAQDAFDAVSSEMSLSWRNRAAAYEAQQADFYVDQQRDGMVQAQIETAISSPEKRATSLEQANAVLMEKFEDQGFDGDRLNQKTQEAMAALLAGQMEALIEDGNTESARDVLEAGGQYLADGDASRLKVAIKNKEAETRTLGIFEGRIDRQMINEMHRNGLIDDGDKVRHLAQLDRYEAAQERQAKAEQAERQREVFERIRVAIDDGLMGRADADLAFERGEIAVEQWSMLARAANDAAETETASNALIDAIDRGLPIDPRNNDVKKGANALFRDKGGQALFAENFEMGVLQTARFAQVGIIPEDARSTLRGFIANGTPDQQQAALKAVGDLYSNYPNPVDAAFSATEVTEAISYRDKLDAGLSPDTAYQAILHEREAANEQGGVHDTRRDEARRIASEFELKDALKRRDADDEFNFFMGDKVGSESKVGSDFAGDEIAKAQILNDFTEAFESNYVIHGDQKLAMRQAAMVMGRTVGVSKANGGRAMLHPPEKYYGLGPGDDGKWMRKSLEETLSKRAGGFRSFELVADVQTSREVREGLPPSYFVLVTEKDGTQVPLPQRWDFVSEQREYIEGLQAEAGADASAARVDAIASDQRSIERQLRSIEAMKTGVGWSNMTDDEKEPFLESERILRQRLLMREGDGV